MHLDYRDYRPADAEACLALFDANVPRYFDPTERDGFAAFLASPSCPYLVGEDERGVVVACGGWFVEPHDDTLGGLAWGILHPSLHGRGIGRELLEVRLVRLRQIEGLRSILVRTSQHTQRFFERAGFAVAAHRRDGHAPGIDFVEMRLPVDSGDTFANPVP